LDTLIDVRREEKVTASSLTDDIIEAGFINRQTELRAIPGIYSRFVEVYNGNLDVGTFKSDDSASRAT
jgi:hypothetical protein